MSSKDVADWDAIENKDDPEHLQQYLSRHPDGRFSSLARLRLKRLGIAEDEPAPPARGASPQLGQARPAPARGRAQTGGDEPRLLEPQRGGSAGPLLIVVFVLVIAAAAGGGYVWWRNDQTVRAEQALGTAAWAATPRDDADALRRFIAGEPGPHRAAAESALAALERQRFDVATAANTPEAFEAYLAEFPEGDNATRASERMQELRRIAARAVVLTTTLAPAGVWSGRMTQEGKRYELIARFGRDNKGGLVAQVRYVEPGCTGIWLGPPGSSARSGPWQLQEILNRNGQRCGTRGSLSLTPISGGRILMEYRAAPGGPVDMSGVLQQQQ